MLGALLFAWSVFDPRTAAHVAAQGDEWVELELTRICWRESRCTAIGVHAVDSRYDGTVWAKAVGVGWLDSACQGDGQNWSTRGPWGLMAAFHIRRVGIPCLPAAVLDVPLVSALVAADKLRRICATDVTERHRSERGWLGKGYACDPENPTPWMDEVEA